LSNISFQIRDRLFTRRALGASASLAVSAGLVVYLLSVADLQAFAVIAKNIPLWVPVALFGIYMSLNLIRAERFRVLLGGSSVPMRLIFPIALYHNFLSQTLPFRTGEVSYVVLTRRLLDKQTSAGVSSLFSSRLFDLAIIIFAGLVGLLAVGNQEIGYSKTLILILAVVFVAVVAGMYFAGPLFKLAISGWLFVARLGPWKSWTLIGIIGERLHEIPAQLDRIREPAVFSKTMALTVGVYGGSFGFNLVLLWAVGADHNVGLLLVVISMVTLAAWLPISVSGFGVIEGGWTIGLVLFTDLSPAEATAIAFFMHGSQVIATALSGLLGLAFLLNVGDISAQPRTSDQSEELKTPRRPWETQVSIVQHPELGDSE